MEGVGASAGLQIFTYIMPLIFILQLALYGLGIYCLISLIRFMKKKTQHDEEMLRKIDQLIKRESNVD